MIITSNTNEQIKNLIHLKDKSKARKTSGTFIVEGIKMFQEIPKEDFIKAYASENFYEKRKEEISDYFRKNNLKEDVQLVSDSVFKKISDTVTPQGILAVVRQKTYSIEDIIKSITFKLMILPDDTIVYPGHGKSTMIYNEKPIYLELKPRLI